MVHFLRTTTFESQKRGAIGKSNGVPITSIIGQAVDDKKYSPKVTII
jgi:hypothetical protein